MKTPKESEPGNLARSSINLEVVPASLAGRDPLIHSSPKQNDRPLHRTLWVWLQTLRRSPSRGIDIQEESSVFPI
jgi:hypothetical protein